jgi:hypothetical protein
VYEVWGNKWVDSFDILAIHDDGTAADFASEFDINDDGLMVWVGEGRTFRDGPGADEIAGTDDDLWGTTSVIGGQNYQWGIPFFQRAGGGGLRLQIGDATHTNVGWINSFNFGAFSMHAQLQGKLGGDAVNTQQQYMIAPDHRAPQEDQFGREEGLKKPLQYWDALYAGAGGSTYFVEDGSYIKLRVLSLNYRMTPSQLARFGLGSAGISSVQLGLIGRDLFTITDYRGFDPEQGLSVAGGAQAAGSTYPQSRSYTAEVQVTF